MEAVRVVMAPCCGHVVALLPWVTGVVSLRPQGSVEARAAELLTKYQISRACLWEDDLPGVLVKSAMVYLLFCTCPLQNVSVVGVHVTLFHPVVIRRCHGGVKEVRLYCVFASDPRPSVTCGVGPGDHRRVSPRSLVFNWYQPRICRSIRLVRRGLCFDWIL